MLGSPWSQFHPGRRQVLLAHCPLPRGFAASAFLGRISSIYSFGYLEAISFVLRITPRPPWQVFKMSLGDFPFVVTISLRLGSERPIDMGMVLEISEKDLSVWGFHESYGSLWFVCFSYCYRPRTGGVMAKNEHLG